MQIKPEIADYMGELLGPEYGTFMEYAQKPQSKSFRVNTLKADATALEGVFKAEKVPWCDGAFFTEDDVGESIEHFLGLIYVQEAASMLAATALSPSEGDRVLDMCAAPGSKTTQMAALMGNGGCIVANDVDSRRLKVLRFNLNRMGVYNTVVTKSEGARLKSKAKFDKILLDAPCSNLGQLRENQDAAGMWNRSLVAKCSKLQKRLVDNAAGLVRDGGAIVYSTCTFSVEENEEVVDYAVERHGLTVEPITGSFRHHPGVSSWRGASFCHDVENTVRIYPHENDTAGFYLAKLVK